jgi:FkbM family methyltransferase
MTAVRRVAAIATDLTCQAVGRRTVVRAARYVLSRARLDYPNGPSTNGEPALQGWILRFSPAGEQVHVADVGANVGRWSESMLAAASRAGRGKDLRLHAFEPDSWAFAQLAGALADVPASLNRTALSDRQGTSLFHVVAPAAGRNSVYPVPGASQAAQEMVVTTTLDSYAEQSGITRFALVKVDAEGHDLAVLRGARTLLAEHRIGVAQFEYNHRWVLARCFLRDAFEFLQAFGYRVGKLTPRGAEFYPGWDADLETFVEGNYLACDPASAAMLPAVTWWKSEPKGGQCRGSGLSGRWPRTTLLKT